jgi:hypothetical protein
MNRLLKYLRENTSVDITPFLLSAMYSDLDQTAKFTGRGVKEANPLAKPLVEPRTAAGETALGILGTLAATNKKTPDWAKFLWALGHTAAVLHNEKKGSEVPGVIFPRLTIKF